MRSTSALVLVAGILLLASNTALSFNNETNRAGNFTRTSALANAIEDEDACVEVPPMLRRRLHPDVKNQNQNDIYANKNMLNVQVKDPVDFLKVRCPFVC